MDVVELITKLSETPGISGHEEPIGAAVAAEFGRHADEVQIDPLGSVAALQRGSGRRPRRRVLLAAHMDEIGLMVSGIERGFLRVAGVVGVDARIMPAQEVIVRGRREVPGVIASPAPHLQAAANEKRVTPIDQLWVDTGLSPAQLKRLVRVGDLVSMRRPVVALHNDLLAGKAFDNRVSVAAVAMCLEVLRERRHAWDVIAVATVQEEKNFAGAATSAFRHAPDMAVVIDVTYGAQNGSSDTETFPLGRGPTIGIGPQAHPAIVDRLRHTASRLELDTTPEPMPAGSGTDASLIQIARDGIPCGIVYIPLRYMHTTVETVAVKDVERMRRLLAAFCAELDEEFFRSLTK